MIKILLQSNRPYVNDFNELVRAFTPHVELAANELDCGVIDIAYANNYLCESAELCNIEITISYNKKTIDKCDIDINTSEALAAKSAEKRHGKIMLYKALCAISGVELPYGSLTGIRPTKLYRELADKGIDASDYFVNTLSVSREKTDFVAQICRNQEGIYTRNEHEIDLFVNIPICVTRCSYCSFISAEYGKITKLIAPYIYQLIAEIEQAKKIIANGYKLRAIYVGGGTPTSLHEAEFAQVMDALSGLDAVEFTLEAGRPDTITRAKLEAMAKANVTRISINPQSFNDNTLKLIGRSHTANNIINSYNIAREFAFDINMDLIAMLPGESVEDFSLSVDKTIALRPDNITVHTLAIKKGSVLKNSEYDNRHSDIAAQMLDYANRTLTLNGYTPYYMYRQKYMSGNLDNAGYALSGKACVYNIDIMEESHSILSCGAGGISKRVYSSENRIERLANPKGIDVYLERLEKISADKAEFFAN